MSNRSETSPASTLPGINYRFEDATLLARALTHRSHGPGHYERLEFLGDSLLNLVIAEQLYHRRPHAHEGDLSRLRSRLVRDVTLARLAGELGLGDHLKLGAGELKSGGYLRESILADVVEAVIGAVYLDGGFEAARRVIVELFEERIESLPDAETLKDAKTRLQERLQARGHELPEYEVIAESGADHAKVFEVECRVGELHAPVRASAGSRRKAEQAAARRMLEALTGAVPSEPDRAGHR